MELRAQGWFHEDAERQVADEQNAEVMMAVVRPLIVDRETQAIGGIGDGVQGNGFADHVFWETWMSEVTMDGDFTAAELRAIADHMEAHMKLGDPPP
jgi:hypothetical protein